MSTTLQSAVESYARARNLSRGTRNEYAATVRKWLFRGLIEQVSPGPYLELYGREEQPNSDWTVYGNQVERRLF